ncbi:MAG TPA: ribosomal protein S18-alanine N-acetyltransferase [Anaerolineales bacterium]|nr:ribosomal protein S18-alanine N-acetyltransferase [Anaerolineales bacterium]
MNTTDESLTIRRMTAEDLIQVSELEQVNFSMPWPVKVFRYELEENEASTQWVATVRDEKTGQENVLGVVVCWLVGDEIHIANLSVHPDHRRKKIASRMLCTALHHYLALGAVTATLEVRAGNQAAQRLYSRFGFQVMGRRPGYYKDNGEAAILLTLHQLDEDHLSIIGCQK